MFRRNKGENKAKLEHKLYLARETPEPIFDLSECDLRNVPQGIYSLCRVFLKETLRLDSNCLTSVSGGGQLKDLHLLKVLDIHSNLFCVLPDDIHVLTNLQEFYVNNNQLKYLPENICNLHKLKILDVSCNNLKQLPNNIGNLISLRFLNVVSNKNLKCLPKSICKAQRITSLHVDSSLEYPPSAVIEQGTESIMQFICQDTGFGYIPPEDIDEHSEVDRGMSFSEYGDDVKAKIWELETIKQQKMQEFLAIEKHNELLQRQELELANAQKVNRQKLLEDLAQEQNRFDSKLTKLQHEKELDRFRLNEQLHEAEQNAYVAIQQLLTFSREPLTKLLEEEQNEEHRLLAAANKYNETLDKSDVLEAMQKMLHEESQQFELMYQQRVEVSKSILQKELELENKMSALLQFQNTHKSELMDKLLEDVELQKAAVGTLLARSDARSWGLIQQVSLVESQLAALTQIEIDRRKLELDHQVNDLAEKRIHLSVLLMDLLDQQEIRKMQILSTIKNLEAKWDRSEDYWLKQYQDLLERIPEGLTQSQKNLDPTFANALLMNGVIHCVPYLAKIFQTHWDVDDIDDKTLINVGMTNKVDRQRVLDAFHTFNKEKLLASPHRNPSAPVHEVEEASAPPQDQERSTSLILDAECVICMERQVQVIFVPCGHICCCVECSSTLTECPLCRGEIERKIKMIVP